MMTSLEEKKKKVGAVYHQERLDQRAEELVNVAVIQADRNKRRFAMVQVNKNTWREVEILTT